MPICAIAERTQSTAAKDSTYKENNHGQQKKTSSSVWLHMCSKPLHPNRKAQVMLKIRNIDVLWRH